MQEYKVKDHESSLLPDGYELELVWSDEFDGKELDRFELKEFSNYSILTKNH